MSQEIIHPRDIMTAISGNGQKAYWAGWNDQISEYDAENQSIRILQLEGTQGVRNIEANIDGSMICITTGDSVRLYSTEGREEPLYQATVEGSDRIRCAMTGDFRFLALDTGSDAPDDIYLLRLPEELE